LPIAHFGAAGEHPIRSHVDTGKLWVMLDWRAGTAFRHLLEAMSA